MITFKKDKQLHIMIRTISLVGFFILFFLNSGYSQARFDYSIKAGAMLPVSVFNRGDYSDANKIREIDNDLGYFIQSNVHMKLDKTNAVGLIFLFQSYNQSIREFLRFPEDLVDPTSPTISHYYSSFDSRNLGLGISYQRKSADILWNAGFAALFPLLENGGYVYYGGRGIISDEFSYEDKINYQVQIGADYIWHRGKYVDATIGLGIAYHIFPTEPTDLLENKLTNFFPSMSLGILFH